jgi:hypothetical protein
MVGPEEIDARPDRDSPARDEWLVHPRRRPRPGTASVADLLGSNGFAGNSVPLLEVERVLRRAAATRPAVELL